ncbi:MAG: glycerate kinase [Candidatus Aminicenantales bacterium]
MELNQLRKDAEAIFHAGVKAVDPARAVRRHVRCQGEVLTVGGRTYDLKAFENVIVIGAGKASASMAQPLEEILGKRLKAGIVQVKYGHSVPLKRIRVLESGHPVPDGAGVRGAAEIIQLVKSASEKDLVVFLISGGGSALLPSPVRGISLEDKQRTTQILLESGATIQEINALRKHISRVKGGRLARLAYPATLVSLILSDVVGDNIDSIASGPAVPDSSTFENCLQILKKYRIRNKIPPSVLEFLEKGARGEVEETLKPGDPAFRRTQNLIIGSNIIAARGAKRKADALGYNSLILSTFIEGETREVARVHAAIAKEILERNNPVSRPACIISGGETTITIRGKGLGGRNQEFVLAAAVEIDGLERVVVLSGGTDGTDGPTEAAGAIADGQTVRRAMLKSMNPEHYLQENDSYHFFKALGDLLITGPTLTNVMDLRLVMAG